MTTATTTIYDSYFSSVDGLEARVLREVDSLFIRFSREPSKGIQSAKQKKKKRIKKSKNQKKHDRQEERLINRRGARGSQGANNII